MPGLKGSLRPPDIHESTKQTELGIPKGGKQVSRQDTNTDIPEVPTDQHLPQGGPSPPTMQAKWKRQMPIQRAAFGRPPSTTKFRCRYADGRPSAARLSQREVQTQRPICRVGFVLVQTIIFAVVI